MTPIKAAALLRMLADTERNPHRANAMRLGAAALEAALAKVTR